MSTQTEMVRCGRLDNHDNHEWPSRPLGANWPVRIQECPGRVVTEGAAECLSCQQPIANCEHSWRGQMRRWAE